MHIQLTPTKRARVVTLKNNGHSFAEIGEELHCDPSTAYRTYRKRTEKENYYDITPGRGHPKRLDTADRRIACRLIESGKAQTAADVQRDHFPDIPARAMRQALQEEGLHGRRKRKVPMMTSVHRKRRIEWAERHENWSETDWSAVIFSRGMSSKN
jgi:transposase